MVAVQPLRLAEHLLRGALHHDAAPAHDQHAVGLGGLLHIMGDRDDRDTGLPQLADRFHDLTAAVRVKHGGRFVQNKAVRPHGDNARNGNALLLPAGKLVGGSITLFIDACQLHGLVNAGADLLRRNAEVLRRKGDILLHDGGNDLVVGVLEYHAHLLAHIVEMILVAGVHPLDQHRARLGQEDRVEVLGQRGFAAAVGPQYSHELAAVDGKAHAVHCIAGLLGVIAEMDVLNIDHRFFSRHGLSLPDGGCAAGHNTAGGGDRQTDLIAVGVAARDGAERRFNDVFHDRRA